jgi:hypothetical protein
VEAAILMPNFEKRSEILSLTKLIVNKLFVEIVEIVEISGSRYQCA